MATTTVRISKEARETLKEMAKSTGRSMSEVLEQSVSSYYEQLILDQSNVAYAAMRARKGEWLEIKEEQEILEGTLLDGLGDT